MSRFIDTVIASDEAGHDLARTIARFADAVAATVGGPTKGDTTALPLPASVPFARVLEGVTRDPRLQAGFTALLAGAVARLATVTRQGQDAGAVRRDVDAEHVGGLLVLVSLGVMVALDVGLPIAPDTLRETVLRLIAPAKR